MRKANISSNNKHNGAGKNNNNNKNMGILFTIVLFNFFFFRLTFDLSKVICQDHNTIKVHRSKYQSLSHSLSSNVCTGIEEKTLVISGFNGEA